MSGTRDIAAGREVAVVVGLCASIVWGGGARRDAAEAGVEIVRPAGTYRRFTLRLGKAKTAKAD